MGRILVRTLGTMTIEVGRRSVGPSAGQVFALLFYLTSRREHATPRRVLQELLFPHTEDSQSGHNLRQLFYRLRRLGVALTTDADSVQIAGSDIWVDWLDILERGELGTSDLEQIAKGLFPGYTADLCEEYREWFESERGTVRLRLSRAVGLQLTQLRRAARWDLVDVASRAMLALDPLNEDGMTARAEALAASGSKTAALRVIDDYLEELGEDQANLRLTPLALRRRISERLPEMGHRAQDDRIFVGREDAMRMLSAAGSAARAGTQQTVLVWGEPGIGKTRLLVEYKALACLQGALAFQATCQPHDVFRPLGILSDLVAQLLEAPGSLGCDPEGRELLSRLATSRNDGALARQLGEAPFPSIVSAFDDLLSSISLEASLLVVVDDGQWLDRLSLVALLTASTSKESRRTCLAFASRDRALLANDRGLADSVTSVRLNPLGHRAALELARSLLTQTTINEADLVEKRIVEEGHGNPFIIRLLSLHFARNEAPESLRQTYSEIFERRLEQLSPDSNRTLEACIVLGKNCTYARLEQLLGMTRLTLLRAIEELDDRGLIELRDGCFVGGHALIGQAVLKRMSQSVQRALNAAAAEMLWREFTPGESGSLPWDCAEHWRLASSPLNAVAVLRDCARRALQIGRPDDALATLKRALEFDAHDEVRLELVEEALRILCLSIDRRQTRQLIAERNRLRIKLNRPATPHDDFELVEVAGDFHTDNDPTTNIGRLRSCVLAAEASERHRLDAARQLLMIGELTLDGELATFAYEATRCDWGSSWGRLTTDLLYHIWFGRVESAREAIGKLAALDLNDDPQRVSVLLNTGYAQYRVGSPIDAEKTLLTALREAQSSGIIAGQMHATLFLGRLYWSTDRVDGARKWLDQFESLYETTPDPAVIGEASVLGAHIAISERELERAERFVRRAVSCTQSRLPLPRLFIGACSARLRAAREEPPCTEAELEELLQLHLLARNVGCQDDVMAAIITALMWFQRHEEAIHLLHEYLQVYRRDSLVPHHELRRVAGQLPRHASVIISVQNGRPARPHSTEAEASHET